MVKKMSEIRLIDCTPIRERFEKWLSLSKEVLDRHDEDEDAAYASMEAYDACLYEIITAPTVEAKPIKTAHWEFREKDREMLEDGQIPYNMWCSNCGAWHDNDDYNDNYCSCCGAKIGEEIEYVDI